MKRKHNQCYLLLGTTIMFLLSCLCSFVFVRDNLNQIAKKNSFESIYVNTTIDYIVPGPSKSQVVELEKMDRNGIAVVTPYYETTTAVDINGSSVRGTSILFPFAEKNSYTPYCARRITNGATAVEGGDAIADQAYMDKNRCAIGDKVTISIAGREYVFEIKGVAETNTYYSTGTIALFLTKEDAQHLEEAGIKYSAAYIFADDITACKTYLYSEYKPLSRLKDKSEFSGEDVYNQHLQNFNEADWDKEITNCQENYNALSIKYENVQTSIWSNIIIMSIIVSITIIVFNTVLLTKESMRNFMKIFLIHKSGTKDSIKAFYKNGIVFNAILFCMISAVLYVALATQTHVKMFDLQLTNCLIPILVSIIISVIMAGVSSSYVEKHYRVNVVKRGDSTEIIQVDVI